MLELGFLRMYTRGAEPRREAFERYIIKAGAHATAAVQCVHAIPDLLAYAVYHGSGLAQAESKLTPRRASLAAVVAALAKLDGFSTLASVLARACASPAFTHVAALSNMSKHRSLIRTSLNEDFTGKRKNRHEVQFEACEYEGDHFRSAAFQAVIEPAFDHVSLAVIETGHALSACLRNAS